MTPRTATVPAQPRPPRGHAATPNAKQASRLALSKSEAADALGLSPDAFEQHVMPGLRVVRAGRRLIVPVVELERWLDRNAAVFGSVRR